MITCKSCGYVGPYSNDPCPLCNAKTVLTQDELEQELSALAKAVKNKDYTAAADGYRMLADGGYTEAEKEYAKILEKGQLVPRNLDLAMKYFYRAAKKNDAYAAYRYSKLMKRENDEVALFWLIFSAILGCKEAYPEVADEFTRCGYSDDALYFYSLAAACDDVDSIVKLAKMYYDGVGVERSEEYAKWYMDKLRIPPIYAIKLAYKLRSVTSKEPPSTMPKNYDGLLHRLKNQAREHGFGTAYLTICQILADRGDGDSISIVGCALIEGNGCKQDFTEGLKMLTKAAAIGNMSAHFSLAELYSNGKYAEKNAQMALEHYKAAGALGSARAYEIAADIYYTGTEVKEDIYAALNLYDLAARLGSKSAFDKYNEIKKWREDLYESGKIYEKIAPEEAYQFYFKSAEMGHSGATLRLAVCYEFGIGTKVNRKEAFRLYNKSCKMGEKDAYLPLGLCYARGFGVKLDFRLARAMLEKAELYGIEGTQKAIRIIMERKKTKLGKSLYSIAMRLIYQKKFSEAKDYLDEAANLMNPRAIYTLGCLYEFGMGAPCDKEKAFALYEQAYSLFFRDPRAKYKLSVLRMLKAR